MDIAYSFGLAIVYSLKWQKMSFCVPSDGHEQSRIGLWIGSRAWILGFQMDDFEEDIILGKVTNFQYDWTSLVTVTD